MSVYVLVGGLRRWLSGAVPRVPSLSEAWLRAGLGVSVSAYLALKLAGAVTELPNTIELVLVPAGLCALLLALNSREGEAAEEEASDSARYALLAGALLAVFVATYVAVNTIPMTSSQDENALLNGAREVAHGGSLRVTSPLNERYDTNIFGSLDVTYRTPTAMYHRIFPGTALSYAPFSMLPGEAGYYLYAALFGTATIVALYLLSWKLLGSWPAAFAAALVFAVSPAFGHWAASVFNNVPVLSMELGALALVLWSTPTKKSQLAVAGALMALAVLMRVTEFIFVPPMLALVWWRCRSVTGTTTFAVTALSCIPLVLLTNAMFFDNPFFFPHVGSGYLPLQAVSGAGHGQGLVERYFLFAIGVSGSSSNFHFSDKVDNLYFHVRYLGSSTFAFPFLALSFLGVVWWVVARGRNAWLLAGALAVTIGAMLFLYGHQHNNYYGYGLPIARSSFVRYSLIVYALLAIGIGAFFLEIGRTLRSAAVARYVLAGALTLMTAVGIFQSYDTRVYGFNRLNASRGNDRQAWSDVKTYLHRDHELPMLIVGFNSMKLVNSEEYPDAVNYSVIPASTWDKLLFPVVDEVLRTNQAYLLVSAIQPESELARAAFAARYFMPIALRSSNWALYEIQPGIYEAAP